MRQFLYKLYNLNIPYMQRKKNPLLLASKNERLIDFPSFLVYEQYCNMWKICKLLVIFAHPSKRRIHCSILTLNVLIFTHGFLLKRDFNKRTEDLRYYWEFLFIQISECFVLFAYDFALLFEQLYKIKELGFDVQMLWFLVKSHFYFIYVTGYYENLRY